MWGHLVPISPFTTQCDESTNDNKTGGIRNKDIHSNHTLKPLQVPGSIGREELLRPFCNVCPTCNSSNCGNKKKSTSPKNKRIKAKMLKERYNLGLVIIGRLLDYSIVRLLDF